MSAPRLTITDASTRDVSLAWGSAPLPTGAEVAGIVTREDGSSGVLLLLPSGIYVQGNAGSVRSLAQREVREQLDAGRDARSAAAAALGARGGKAGRGATKTRDRAHYQEMARRSAETRRKK